MIKMKLPIKFRWQDKRGQTFYSTLEFKYGAWCLWTSPSDRFHGEIDEETIKQLIGYDKNGHEVYDGDALQTEKDDTIYAAVLRHAKVAPCDDMEFTEMAKRCGWTVKEVEKNESL